MSKLFHSLGDLLADLQFEVEVIAEEKLVPKGIEEVWVSMYKNVYEKKSNYPRTYQLLDSITGKVTRKSHDLLRVSIFNDPLLMSDPHASWEDGKDQRRNIAKWMDGGHEGIVHYKAADYFSKADDKFSRSAATTLNKELKKQGIKTKKRS